MIPSGKHKVTRQLGYILEKNKMPRVSYLLLWSNVADVIKCGSYYGRERKKEKYKMCRVVTLMSFSKSVTYRVIDSPNTIFTDVVCGIILCRKCKIFSSDSPDPVLRRF
jgi:hypothetical protein